MGVWHKGHTCLLHSDPMHNTSKALCGADTSGIGAREAQDVVLPMAPQATVGGVKPECRQLQGAKGQGQAATFFPHMEGGKHTNTFIHTVS